MQGTITAKDVLLHPVLILTQYGPACYLRCLQAVVSRRRTTFLAIVFDIQEAESR